MLKCPMCNNTPEEPDEDWDYRFCGCYPPCDSRACERDEDVAQCPNCMELFWKAAGERYP